MISFIENAFKHSVDSSIENGIELLINFVGNKLHFICNNYFYKNDTDKDEGHGIGLKTVKKRLDSCLGLHGTTSTERIRK